MTNLSRKVQFHHTDSDLQEQVEKLKLYREQQPNEDAGSSSDSSNSQWRQCPENPLECFSNFEINEQFTLRDLLVGSLPIKKNLEKVLVQLFL